MREPKTFQKDEITVAFMIEQLRETVGVEIETVTEGVDATARRVTEDNLHRPGLALAGYVELFTHQRVQILGNTENRYLHHLDSDERQAAFENLIQFEIPCILLTD